LPEHSIYDERELLALISKGDGSAFRELYELYRERIYAVSRKMTQSDDVASDIVQDVFLNIWKNRDGLAIIENPSSYLFTAVYRRVYQHYRKLALERKFQQATQKIERVENTTEETVLAHESRNMLSMAVSQLPPQQQMVFKLSKEEGYSREDVAEYLNISPNTVKNHLSKALKFVQTYLKSLATIFFFLFCK